MRVHRRENYNEGQVSYVRRSAVAAAVVLFVFAVLTVGTASEPMGSFGATANLPPSFGIMSSFGKVFSQYSLPSDFLVRGDKKDVVSSDKDAVGSYDNSHLEYLEQTEAVFAQTNAPDGALPVIKTTLYAAQSFENIGGVYINNESKKELLSVPIPIKLGRNSSAPQVLIYHTHGTESYNPGYSFYDDSVYSPNSEDMSENVVRIGAVIKDILENSGVGVVHLTEMFDASGYTDAYARSCEAVETVLEKYPSIKIVLDIHRDTVIDSEGTKLRPVVQTEDGAAAQLMILLGSGKKGAEVPLWSENLSFALAVCSEINNINEDILRPIMLRATRYNQHLSTGSILVEVGTCGNTLSEAERAAEIFAKALVSSCLG